jgi:hypothetical protein
MSASKVLSKLSFELTHDGADPLTEEAFVSWLAIKPALRVLNALPELAALAAAAEAQNAENIQYGVISERKVPMALRDALKAVDAKLAKR